MVPISCEKISLILTYSYSSQIIFQKSEKVGFYSKGKKKLMFCFKRSFLYFLKTLPVFDFIANVFLSDDKL